MSQGYPRIDDDTARILRLDHPHEKSKRKAIEKLIPQMDCTALKRLRNVHFGDGFPTPTDTLYRMMLWELTVTAPNRDRAWEMLQEGLKHNRPLLFQWLNLKKHGIPLRRVSPDAMRLIESCPSPSWVPLWEESTTPKFQSIHYILPKDSMKVDGQGVTDLTVTILNRDELREESERQYITINELPEGTTVHQPERRHMMMVTAHAGVAAYSMVRGFDTPEIDPFTRPDDAGDDGIMTTEELAFTENLISVGLQLLLLENTRPEFDIPERTDTQTSGSGKQTHKILPKLIGGNLHQKTRRIGEGNQAGDRKRPKEHWRGSHWKQVPYGPKSSLRRPKLILPCLVNPEVE